MTVAGMMAVLCAASAADLTARCAVVGNDDTIRDDTIRDDTIRDDTIRDDTIWDDTIWPYDQSLRDGLIAAYGRVFPGARQPGQDQLEAETHLRCMNGHLYACFTGANLPCGKINQSRENRGADAFCRDNPDAAVVPAYATGHDSLYAYGCRGGRAEVTGTSFPELDARGFAKRLWTPVD